MAKKKRTNPKRILIPLDDVKRELKKTADNAIRLAMVLFLMVLKDDFGFDNDQITLAWERMDKLSEEVKEGRVNLHDFTTVLRDEYGIDYQ